MKSLSKVSIYLDGGRVRGCGFADSGTTDAIVALTLDETGDVETAAFCGLIGRGGGGGGGNNCFDEIGDCELGELDGDVESILTFLKRLLDDRVASG